MNLPKTLDYKIGKSRVALIVVYMGGLEVLALGQPQGHLCRAQFANWPFLITSAL